MSGESLAVIAVIFAMSAMFLRARRKELALLAMPLTAVPVSYLLAVGIYRVFPRLTQLPRPSVTLILLAAGIGVGCALCALLSLGIQSRRIKTGYLVCAILFQVTIGIGYLINLF